MVKVVFEDHPDAAISRLIRSAYGECSRKEFNQPYKFREKDNIWFTKGNGHILQFIKKHYKKEYTFLVYIDLVPDNIETREVYTDLKDYIEENKLWNIVVVPIRCIEYYVLLSLLDMYSDEQLKIWMGVIDYRKIFNENSLEKYYKAILNKYVRECMQLGGAKKFYKEDCLCNNALEDCKPLSLEGKGKMIVRKLPIRKNFESTDPGVSKEDVYRKIDELFNEYSELRATYEELNYC